MLTSGRGQHRAPFRLELAFSNDLGIVSRAHVRFRCKFRSLVVSFAVLATEESATAMHAP